MYNPFKLKRKSTRSMTLTSTAPFIVTDNGQVVANKLVSAETALRNSDIYAVVNRIASDIASCDIDCPNVFQNILYNPNPLMNKFSFYQSVLASMLLSGNAFVSMHRNGNNIPDRLELIPSQNVTMTLTDNAEDILYTFIYEDGRPTATFDSQNVLHFKLIATGYEDSLFTGRSPLESLQSELNIQEQSHKLALKTLINGIYPTTVLKIPETTLNADAKNHIRDEFQKQATGDNAGKAIVLDSSLSMEQISINNNVAKFLNNYSFSQTQIAKAFGIPDSYLNGKGDQQSSVDMLRSLYISSLSPYIAPIESELTNKLGAKIKLSIESSIDKDHQTLISNLAIMVKNGAISGTQAQMILANYRVYGMDDVIQKTGVIDTAPIKTPTQ